MISQIFLAVNISRVIWKSCLNVIEKYLKLREIIHFSRLRLHTNIRTNFTRRADTCSSLRGKRASRFNAQTCTPIQWIGNIFARPLCAIIPQLRPISTIARRPEWILCNSRVTAHQPLIFRACHRNSISARWSTLARNSNSVSVVASINYSIGQLAGNN